MKKSKYPETQIVHILKEQELGAKVEEITRKYGISSATFFKWKSRYGGMDVSDVKRMKELEAENSRLKRLYSELALENHALKELITKIFKPCREKGFGGIYATDMRFEYRTGL